MAQAYLTKKADATYILVSRNSTFDLDDERNTGYNLWSPRVTLTPGLWYWSCWMDMDSPFPPLLLPPWKGQQPTTIKTPSPYHWWHCFWVLPYVKCSSGLQPTKLAILWAGQLPYRPLLPPRIRLCQHQIWRWSFLPPALQQQSPYGREVPLRYTCQTVRLLHKYPPFRHCYGYPISSYIVVSG